MNPLFPDDILRKDYNLVIYLYFTSFIEVAQYKFLTIPKYQNARYESLTAIWILETKN